MMGKNKADLLADARKAGITGLSKDSTVEEIRAAMKKEPTSASKPAKSKTVTPEQEQEQMVAEREKRRAARRKEEAQASEARAEAEADAKALIRTAPQQAVDRAEAEAKEAKKK